MGRRALPLEASIDLAGEVIAKEHFIAVQILADIGHNLVQHGGPFLLGARWDKAFV